MKNLKISHFITALFLTSLVYIPNISYADPEYRISPYIWATEYSGNMTVDGIDADTRLDIGDAFDKGNGGLNLDFEVRGGGLSLLSQFVYSPLSDTNPSIPGPVFDAAKLDYEQFFLTEMIGLNLLGEGANYFDFTFGGRLVDISNELKLRGGPEDRRKYDDGDTWVDPLVGFNTNMELGDGVQFHLTGDIGGFNAASSLTWQAMTFLDFQLNSAAYFMVGYKAISIDYEQDDFIYDIVMHGPTLGFNFRF